MNRLQLELQRLYLVGTDDPAFIDAGGRVRALVLEVARPASWDVLGKVWHGVQTELDLPAPGIAVSGTDGLQLWFSLAVPLGARDAHALLEALRSRFLPEIAPRRIRLLPSPTASSQSPASFAGQVPACDESTGNWSAFVAADLAPVFADTPWLDIPPSEDGQAGLLRGLESVKPAALDIAWERLGRPAPRAAVPDDPTPAGTGAPSPDGVAAAASASFEARRFLMRVMNDETLALGLRIEAARVLLTSSHDSPPRESA